MKILAIADTEDPFLYDYYTPRQTEGIDLILSCGDLNAKYLDFLTTVSNIPLIYVRGNHDGSAELYEPPGCICAEDTIIEFQGLRILGLGGSMRYRQGANQYTEEEMRKRIMKLKRKIRYTNGFDLLLTHAPAQGYGDLPDRTHQGFACFNELLQVQEPGHMVYGHVHKEYGQYQRFMTHPSGTTLVHADAHTVFEIEPLSYPEPGHTGSFLHDFWYAAKHKCK